MLNRRRVLLLLTAVLIGSVPGLRAQPLVQVVETVNGKLVKLFGAGGFNRLNNYGTGVVVSPDGHILTVANALIDTPNLVVHLVDGRRLKAEVMVIEPELDAALLRVVVEGKKAGDPTGLDLAFYDIAAEAKRPVAAPGDTAIGFTNQFEIALRDEALTVQKGVIGAYTKLSGKLGAFDFPYKGDVYVTDAITNNPGSAGGALVNRKGELLGIIGRELKNSQTNTWMNYAIPVGAKVDVTVKENDKFKTVTVSLPEFVAKGMKGEYRPTKSERPTAGEGGWAGIVFVPNVLARTPAYVEAVLPGSPAEKAKLQPDDLVSFVDGEAVASIAAFDDYLRTRTRPGSVVRLEVRRGGTLQPVELTLGTPPARAPVAPAPKK
ncbi:MAG TPA: trypsin-like peptidase domain-containing protein [Urbifossiella sp.]|nr:trypsin-like peptidase domain-containing protein [Urbifossiella sp.]